MIKCEDSDVLVRYEDCYVSVDEKFFVDNGNCRSHEVTLLQTFLKQKIERHLDFIASKDGAFEERGPYSREDPDRVRACADAWLTKNVKDAFEFHGRVRDAFYDHLEGCMGVAVFANCTLAPKFDVSFYSHDCITTTLDLLISDHGLLTALQGRDFMVLLDEVDLCASEWIILLGRLYVEIPTDVSYQFGWTNEVMLEVWKGCVEVLG